MFKKVMVAALILGIAIPFTTAIEVTDIQVQPEIPEENDTVNITATVDAQDDYIENARLTVFRNDTEILETDMQLYDGVLYDVAEYRYNNAFEVLNESSTYYVTVTGVASNGETNTGALIYDYTNGLEVEEDLNVTDDGNTSIWGVSIYALTGLALILATIYAVLID